MKRYLALFVVVALAAVSSPAVVLTQTSVVVEADRVTFGGEFVPRCAAQISGVLAPDTYDCVEVGSSLAIPAGTVQVSTLLVLPGASLTIADGAEIVIRDVPIDGADPWQWGRGLVVFGSVRASGSAKTPAAQASADLAAGATVIPMTVPADWRVGDEVVIADTVQPAPQSGAHPRREAATTITSISGSLITVASPLGFDRPMMREPNGDIVAGALVMNLTRSIVIRSENPTGVRGHVAVVGEGASWDLVGVAFRGLGRTQNAPRNNSNGISPGTNQAGRYGFHAHRTGRSTAVRQMVGSSIVADGSGHSWGAAIHQTDATVWQRNVFLGYDGAGLVTEDGPERDNVITENVFAYAKGISVNPFQGIDLVRINGCPGCDGSGLWLQGVGNTIDRNIGVNNAVGINLLPVLAVGAAEQNEVPRSFADNAAYVNRWNGLENWPGRVHPITRFTSAHNGAFGVFALGGSMSLIDLRFIASGSGIGIGSSNGYNDTLEIIGGEIRGFTHALQQGLAIRTATIRGVVLQSASWSIGPFNGGPRESAVFERVRFERMPGQTEDYFWDWTDGHGNPAPAEEAYKYQRGPKVRVVGWNGTGVNCYMFDPRSASNAPTPGARGWWRFGSWAFLPEEGLTQKQAFLKYGMAYDGAYYELGQELIVSGVRGGVCLPRDTYDLGPARAVLTVPNVLEPALVEDGSIWLQFMLTGRRDIATERAFFTIDGGPRQEANVEANSRPDHRVGVASGAAVTPGTHTVEAWRENASGVRVGETLTFTYGVGAVPPPDPCVASPLVPIVSVTADGHVVTWTGTITVTDERGCSAVVSR